MPRRRRLNDKLDTLDSEQSRSLDALWGNNPGTFDAFERFPRALIELYRITVRTEAHRSASSAGLRVPRVSWQVRLSLLYLWYAAAIVRSWTGRVLSGFRGEELTLGRSYP